VATQDIECLLSVHEKPVVGEGMWMIENFLVTFIKFYSAVSLLQVLECCSIGTVVLVSRYRDVEGTY